MQAFAKYENTVGYVQGMNFIVGSLLFHCSEEVTFWLFVSLIEDFQLRDIFQPQLPGLYKHSKILEHLLKKHLPEVFDHLQENNIRVEMYASDWIFALYTNVIPNSHIGDFLDCFFEEGWCFFYKFTLT